MAQTSNPSIWKEADGSQWFENSLVYRASPRLAIQLRLCFKNKVHSNFLVSTQFESILVFFSEKHLRLDLQDTRVSNSSNYPVSSFTPQNRSGGSMTRNLQTSRNQAKSKMETGYFHRNLQPLHGAVKTMWLPLRKSL